MSTMFYMGTAGHSKEIALRSSQGAITWKVEGKDLESCPCCGVELPSDMKVFMDEYGRSYTRAELRREIGEFPK